MNFINDCFDCKFAERDANDMPCQICCPGNPPSEYIPNIDQNKDPLKRTT